MNDTSIQNSLNCFQSDYIILCQETQNDHSYRSNQSLHQRVKKLSLEILDLSNQVNTNSQPNTQLKLEIDQLNSKIQLLHLLFNHPQASSSTSYTSFAHKIRESLTKLADDIFQIPCINQYNLNKGKVTCGFHSLKNALCALAIFRGFPLDSQIYPFFDLDIYKHVERLMMKFSQTSNLSDATEVQLRAAWQAIVSGEEPPFPGTQIPLQLNSDDLSIIYVANMNIACSDQVSVCDLVKLKNFMNQNGPCVHSIIVGSEGHWVNIFCEKNDRNDLTWYCMDSSNNQTESLIETVKSIQELLIHFETITPKLYFESIGETIERRRALIGPDHQLIDESDENRSLFISENSTLLPLLSMATEFFSNMSWIEDYESKSIRIHIENVIAILDYYRAQGISNPAIAQMESKLASAIGPDRTRMSQREIYFAKLEMKYGSAANELLKINEERFESVNAELILNFVMSLSKENQNEVLHNILSIINGCGCDYINEAIDLNSSIITHDNLALIHDLYNLNLLDIFKGQPFDVMKGIFDIKRNRFASLFTKQMRGNLSKLRKYVSKLTEQIQNNPQVAMALLNHRKMFSEVSTSMFRPLYLLAFERLCDELNQNLITGRNNQINRFMRNYLSYFEMFLNPISANRAQVFIRNIAIINDENPLLNIFFNSLKSNIDVEFDFINDHVVSCLPGFLSKYDLWGNLKTLKINNNLGAFYSGHLELLSNLNSLELRLDDISPEFMSAIKKLKHLKQLSLKDFDKRISLDELEYVKCLVIERGGRKINRLPRNIEYLTLSGHVDIDLKKIFLQPLPHLKGIKLIGCSRISSIEWVPDTVEKLIISNNINLVIKAFPSQLKFLEIMWCSMDTLPMLPSSITELSITNCSNLRKIQNIPCNIRALTIDECDELSNKTKFMIVESLIDHNFELAKEFIWDLDSEDLSILEPKIASKDLFYFLDNIEGFESPNERFRLKLLKRIIEKERDNKTALAYTPKLAIQDKQKLNALMMQIKEIKELVLKHPDLDPNLVDFTFIWTLFCAIDNQDEDILLGLLKFPGAAKMFSHVKDLPDVKNFVMKHILVIYGNRKALRTLEKIYSPDNEDNFEMYPFNPYVKKELLCINTRIQYPYEHPHECLKALGTILSIKDLKIDQLRVHFYGQRGDDVGGLGRQFIYSLFEGLIHSSSGIRFICRQNGKFIPVLTSVTSISEDEISSFESLGRLFAFLLSSSTSYPIGEIFDKAFFGIISDIMFNECSDMNSNEFLEHLKQLPNASMFWSSLVDDAEDLRKMEEINLAETVDQLSPETLDYFKCILLEDEIDASEFNNLKQDFYLEVKSIYFKAYIAIHAVAKGLLKSLPIHINYQGTRYVVVIPRQFEHYAVNYSVHISKVLQGEISKEKFNNAIEIRPKDHEKKDEIKNWMNEWIDHAKIEDVRLLLIQLTGSPAISSRIKISLHEEEEFRYETCFYRLYVPASIQKEQLFEELDNVIKEIKNAPIVALESGFNIP